MLVRAVVAFMIAVVLALPALLSEPWQIHEFAPFVIILLNLPGYFCGLLFGGRFFPPEGYIGQSPTRWILMVLVQAFVWFLILSCFHFVASRFKKVDPDATRRI